MRQELHLGPQDLLRFASWSGDRNPLHVDAAAARRSSFGRPVVHGILTTIHALGAAAVAPDQLRRLEVEFRGVVHPDATYAVAPVDDRGSRAIAVRSGESTALLARVTGGSDPQAGPDVSWVPAALRNGAANRTRRLEPAPLDADSLKAGLEIFGSYDPDGVPPEYRAALRPVHARVLGLCSYLVGMELPGLRSLFTRLDVRFVEDAPDADALVYRARVVRFDTDFRLLDVRLDVATAAGHPVAAADLRAYVRFTPATVDPAVTARLLSAGCERLRGQIALVVGGTRGLGAEITSALAVAGCHVYATYRDDIAAADELTASLGEAASRVQFLKGDAADGEWCGSAAADILRRHDRLDLLVLNACAPPDSLRFGAQTQEAFGAYIAANLPLAQMPLASCLPALVRSRGTVIAISSAFVADAPAGMGHYVALKEAVESTVRTAVRESDGLRAIIARPPRLQTAWNDTPTGVLGAISARSAAAHIVNAAAEPEGRDALALLADFPELRAADASAAAADAQADLFVSLVASFTLDPLVAGIEFWFRELGVRGQVDAAPYGQILQTLLSPTGGLSGRRGVHLVLLRLRDWLRELPADDAASPEFVRAYLDATLTDFERAMRTHRAQAGAETLLMLCPSAPARLDAAESLIARTEAELQTRLAGLPGLTIVRATDFHEAYGVADGSIADPLRDKLAHIPYQPEYLHTLATIAIRHVHRKLVPPRKVVAVDCDNTLWAGVVGEVGPEGLRFDAGHQALHETLSRLAAGGVLVALCSKNEEPDVWKVFDTRRELRLTREAIVAGAINWNAKSSNIRALAERLNLGLDSFVFIDDNPVECAEMRAACPQVLTIEWPQDSNDAVRLLRHTWELDARDTTVEDRRRTELYKEEFRRQELQTQTLTFAEFIAKLELAVDIAPLTETDIKRASQLTLRTNQFNFTTVRRDEADLQALIAGGTHEISTVRVRDRFGDYGLVGLLISEARGRELLADTFLLSCRVLGRGVEHQMVRALGRAAAARGAATVRLRVDRTKRNTPARNFLQSIASCGVLRQHGEVVELELTAEAASAIAFEPPDAAPSAVAEDASARVPEKADVGSIRRREAQIGRTAFELDTARALAAAIDGATGPADSASTAGTSHGSNERVDASFVFETFARALRTTLEEVKRIDNLEALGCDSFKIVEITVALLERYPSLPATLLFEHRTVSDIARHIEALTLAPAAASGTSAPSRPAAVVPAHSADIAVVGMHLRCAGAQSPDELWTLLERGATAVTPVPRERPFFFGPLEDTRPHFAGLLDGIDRFDAELFGITPREADVMDPQLRLFLEVAWGALEDAGCLGADLEADTGVFAGVMYGDYASRANPSAKAADNPFKCWENFSLANRVSQVFGFRGPSLAVDTACSSSATAVHLACRALNAADCRVAIAGGVNLVLDPDRFVQLGRLGILSMSGRCLAFGAEADGTVLGEGVGVVVLRRLDDAISRGDRIYGVIKATGVSTGSGTVGFTAPNPVAQSEAIRRAVASAGVDPRTIGYVETHGTGTTLGDPIEVRGLTLAYGDTAFHDAGVDVTPRCAIGSVKPNIGHLEAGAGVLGLIKLLLQLHRRTLLPSITSSELNPQIPFADIPFALQRGLTPWTAPSARVNGRDLRLPLRGALNSFGVGGANVHVIAEEAPISASERTADARSHHVVAVSAKSADALGARLRDVADLLATRVGLDLEDVCYSLNSGRRHLAERAAIVARTRDEMIRALREVADGGEPAAAVRGKAPATAPNVVFLFTGQGSQVPGMGRELYETQPVFRAALDRCFELFEPLLTAGSLKACMFAEEGTPPAALLNQTGFTQPALFSLGYALSELWRSWGVTPAAVVGHSIGEITAMCVAGGLSLADAVSVVAARGRLMQALPPGGAMTSVMTSEARVADALAGLEDRVSIAAINAPAQIVISGEAATVEAAASRLAAEGVKTKNLVVSHAFHSPLMRPMLAEYAQVLTRVRFMRPQTVFISTILGRAVEGELLEPAYWLRNVSDPVRFTDAIAAADREGMTAFVEMGPQPVLLGLGRQCLAAEGAVERLWLPSARRDGSALGTLLASLAQLYVGGGAIDWRSFDAPYGRKRVSLPAYPFRGRRHWIASLPSQQPSHAAPSRPADSRASSTALYEMAWRLQPEGSVRPAGSLAGKWLVFADDRQTGSSLVRELENNGAHAELVTLDTARDFDRVMRASGGLRGIVYLPQSTALASKEDVGSAAAACVDETFALMRAVAAADGLTDRALWIVTRDGVATSGGADHQVDIGHGAVWGAGRTFALEHRRHWGGLIDLPSGTDPDITAAVIARELRSGSEEDQIAIRSSGRYVARLARTAPAAADPPRVSAEGTYLITGGGGALGLHTARWLVSRGARQLVLAGRRGVAADAIRELQEAGAVVSVVAADVATREGVDAALAAVPASAPLAGIVHAAGIDDTTAIADTKAGDARRVMAAKAAGAWWLHERTRDLPLRTFICFSSIASVLGSSKRGAYAAANAFLDALAHERRRLHLPATSINWGPWAGGGMATEAALDHYRRAGNVGLDPADALRAMDALLSADVVQAMVADIDWERFRISYDAGGSRAILAELQTADVASARGEAAPKRAPWIDHLQGMPAEERLAGLTSLLRQEVAQTLGLEGPAEVPPDRVLRELGMDSLMSADFAQRLQKRLGIRSTALVFEHPTVARLAAHLTDVLTLGSSVGVAVAEVVTAGAAAGYGDVPRAVTTALDLGHSGRPIATGTERYLQRAEPDVFEFQRLAFPTRDESLIASRWRWMFVESAQRLDLAPQVWLHRESGRIVGHNGVIPVRLKVGDTERLTGWFVETMVLPEYRSHGVGARLMVEAQEDMPFALSLGQTEQMRDIQLRLGWHQVAALESAQLLIRPERVLKGKLPSPAVLAASVAVRAGGVLRDTIRGRETTSVRELARFDGSHDQLWDDVAGGVACAVRRDASYLNWKYVDQPGQDFLRLEVCTEAGSRAVVVLMFREPDSAYRYRRGFIVDLAAPLDDQAMMAAVLSAAVRAATERGADSLLCLHVNRKLTMALQREGFRMRPPSRYLLVRPDGLPDGLRELVLDARSWLVTQGDSDIDRPW